MSKKSASDMKQMIQRLKVNQPFALSKAGPSFVPPQAQDEAPQSGVPLFEVPAQIEVAQAEETQIEVPQNELPRAEIPQTELPSDKAPQNKSPRNKVAQTELANSEMPQNKGAKSEEPQKELPQNEVTQKEAPQGFFKLSHAVFTEPALQDLSGDCFKLFLWLSSRAWRYPTSDGSIQASISFMESGAGIPHATVSRSLKTLKEKKLITIVTVDFKKGNIWKISPIACGNHSDDNPPRKKVPQNEVAQNAVQAASKGGNESLNLRQPLPQNEGQIRSFKKVKKLKETSPSRVLLVDANPEPELSVEQRQQAVELFENSVDGKKKEKLTDEFVVREYPHGYLPPTKVIRSLVAVHWYRNQIEHAVAIGT